MKRSNKHGLSRSIPDPVMRAVRQRDGFGCVMCGKAVYDYEHFDPEFADALSHDVNGIVLLCIEHHGLKSRKLLSKDTIRRHITSPACKQTGFSFGPFDIGNLHPEIILGQLTCKDVRCLLCLDGDEIFSVSPPTALGLPFRINADIRDANGQTILRIVDNEWRSEVTNWDVDVIGPVITIRNAPRSISLALRSEPPDRIVIERLDMNHKGHSITCREGKDLEIINKNGSVFRANQVHLQGFDTAVEISNQGLRVGVNKARFPIDLGSMGVDRSSKTRRNAVCECGSRRRYKHCHGKL